MSRCRRPAGWRCTQGCDRFHSCACARVEVVVGGGGTASAAAAGAPALAARYSQRPEWHSARWLPARQRRARRGRLVGQRAGHALRCRRRRGSSAPRVCSLRTIWLSGLVLFARFLGDGAVDLRDDLRAHAARADERREQRFDALRVVFLEPVRQLELLLRAARTRRCLAAPRAGGPAGRRR